MTQIPGSRMSSFIAAAAGSVLLTALLYSPVSASDPDATLGETATAVERRSSLIRHRSMEIDGLNLFYREAGPPDAPVLLLLHGFPASSFMYRDLLEQLSDRFRLLAPDYPGFGYSDAPSTQVFSYTFDHLADIIEQFTDRLGIDKYGLYMQDFGGPVGFRMASRHPHKISFLVVQNANAYEEGLPDAFWAPARALWQDPSIENYEKIRNAAMSDAALEWNYTHGVSEPERIAPESWVLQKALLGRPGNKEAMLALLYDYRVNLELYPEWHRYFREHQPPMLIAWGEHDVIFPPAGAHAYFRDLPSAELHLLETGHFALEDHARQIAHLTREFFEKRVLQQ